MLEFEGQPYDPLPGESVLDCLLRYRVSIGFSCREGDCLSCIIRCVEGELPPDSQEGLTLRMQRSGHFKACVCPAECVRIATRAGS